MRRLYFDYNATCPLRPAAREALRAGLEEREVCGNPSSAHAAGRRARHLLEEARERVAAALDAHRDEVVFTSGGSEANALALGSTPDGRPVAVAAHEHPSVLGQPRVVTLPVEASGRVDLTALDAGSAHAAGIPATPGMVSVALANHETGTLGDVPAALEAARRLGALMHADACQAVGRIPVSFRQLGVDLLSVSAHKLGGPVGIGALLVRKGTTLSPLLRGGGQEGGLRAGTAPAWLAHAFAAAAEDAVEHLDTRAGHYRRWSSDLYSYIRGVDGSCVRNSPATGGLPNTLNLSFPGRPGVSLVHRLDLEGVCVSHGSACASGSLEPSPVLLAMGLGHERASCSVRISCGPDTDDDDVRTLMQRLAIVLENVGARDTATRDARR